MKISSIFIITYFLVLESTNLKAQSTTDIDLHNRYWTYRENFRKYFIKIGEKNGEGLPFSDIKVGLGADVIPLDNKGVVIPNTSGGFKGMLNVGGDVTYYFAEYLGILSSEYWLLKNQGKGESEEMKAVKSEIYFAINAIERLDKASLKYFEPETTNPTPPIDGFFIRDDEVPSIIKYFELYNYPQVEFMSGIASHGREIDPDFKDRKKDGVYISSQLNSTGIKEYYWWNKTEPNAKQTDLYAFYRDPETKADRGNEMSMDQLIGVLFGLKCVVKFVDSDLEVDPDGELGTAFPEKNLVTWSSEIVDRMMTLISGQKNGIRYFDPETNEHRWQKKCVIDKCGRSFKDKLSSCKECDEEREWKIDKYKPNNPILASSANYVVSNPAKGNRHVARGPYAFFFGYPLELIGEQLANANRAIPKNYAGVSVTLDNEEQLMRYAGDGFALMLMAFGSASLLDEVAGVEAKIVFDLPVTILTNPVSSAVVGKCIMISLDLISTCLIGKENTSEFYSQANS